ncbi:MAG: nuclease-related domain-containing protein [Propionicimonas sp.]
MADGAELLVRHWSRYGKRRLYVNSPEGHAVGWVDLLTGARRLGQAQDEAAFAAAVDAYLAEHPDVVATWPMEPDAPTNPVDRSTAVVSAMPPPEPEPSIPEVSAAEPPVEPEWLDLASNRPGQGIREKAEEELAAMRANSKVRTFLARALDLKTDERAYRVGADGEETVGARLEKLVRDGWYVLHSVPVGAHDSDIDHILIGPGGVFTINTKTHPGGRVWVGQYAIKVNGQSQPYLRNSRFEAKRAAKLLTASVGWSVEVKPVLVFLTGTWIPNVTYRQQPDDVWVLDRLDIPKIFRKREPRLSSDQVKEVFEQARRSTTWLTGQAPRPVPGHV